MSLRCTNCSADINNVGEVRGCGTCQRNGTAGGVHSKFQNGDSVEALVADANPGAFPFVPVEPYTGAGNTPPQAESAEGAPQAE